MHVYFSPDLGREETARLDQITDTAASGKFYKPALIGELEEWAWKLGGRETEWIREEGLKALRSA